jgi:outer membrane protein OmpA-like peptidoglycan-associated protein
MMNRMKKLSALWLAIAIMACSPLSLLRADGSSDPRVKVLLEEALHLYSERQYVRALDLFNQVQRIDPDNKTAKEYIKSSEERISEWENQGDTAAPKKDSTNWDSLLNERSKKSPAEPQANANDLIAARRSLVERMRNRSVRADDIVKISDGKRGVEVVLFHDQLFLPGLQTLRDEALPILDNVAQLLRQRDDREVTITSQAKTDSNDPFLLFPEMPDAPDSDPSLPQMKSAGTSMLFQDIEATRSLILFTYLAQRSMGESPSAIKE